MHPVLYPLNYSKTRHTDTIHNNTGSQENVTQYEKALEDTPKEVLYIKEKESCDISGYRQQY